MRLMLINNRYRELKFTLRFLIPGLKSFSPRSLLIPFLFLFISCVGVYPDDVLRTTPVFFRSVESVVPNWQPFVSGIGFFHGRIGQPALEFWALRVDLRAPNVRIVVRGGALSDEQTSTRVSGFVRDNNLVAGINALPFFPSSSGEGEQRTNVGIVISDSRMISPPHFSYDALVFYRDGTAAVVSQPEIISTENIQNAVGGFFRLLQNGEPVERVLNLHSRHPRTAAGISADRRVLYLLVIDGRREGSIGSTELETALLLRSFGSGEGINFDGGGSSTLVLRFPNGSIRPVNSPAHNIIPGRERAVAGSLGIAAD